MWEQLQRDEFIVILSPVVFDELGKCKEPLQKSLLDYVMKIKPIIHDETIEAIRLADEYLKTGIFKIKNYNDCRHIAIASIFTCKYILSWNMKHFVKRKTIEMVQTINQQLGIAVPTIITPSIFIEGDENYD